MAAIRPFRGLRYRAEAGPLTQLVAPPYDVLSPSERDQYAARSPYNVVHLTLPEQKPDDRSKFVKYARSAAALAEWRRENVLSPEDRPTIYRYTQTFHLPHTADAFTRTSIVALIKVEPYDRGVVLPHEQTFPKHKEDRLRILEATRAHLECIFGLYEDPDGAILSQIESAPAGSKAEVTSEDGVHQVLEPITDEESLRSFVSLLADKKVWIADGHHRYETALAFRKSVGEREGLIAEDFMMMALSSMSDPGLVLLPTHRIVSSLSYGQEEIQRRLSEHFDLHATHSRNVMDQIAKEERAGNRAFGFALEGGVGLVGVLRDPESFSKLDDTAGSAALKGLDVSLLHNVILPKLLGVEGNESLTYTRDALEAVHAADQGAAVAVLMNAPTVDDMKSIAMGGEKMPQKSTYYFPKVLSGLVLWSLNDF